MALKKCLFAHLNSGPCQLCLADAPERNLGTSMAFEGNTTPPPRLMFTCLPYQEHSALAAAW